MLPFETLKNQIDDKLLLHFHGDSFGENSGFEGEYKQGARYGTKFIKECLKLNLSAFQPAGEEEDVTEKYEKIIRLGDGANFNKSSFKRSIA